MFKLTKLFVLTLCLAAASHPVFAQCKAVEEDRPVAASPSQPTITDSPDTISPGVAQVEYGWQQALLRGGAKTAGSGVLYKMGVFCNLEFRVSFTPWLSDSTPGQSTVHGIGDTWITGQYRFHTQTPVIPAMSFEYSIKQPTADSAHALGSGQRDQLMGISAGKDFENTSFNFETKYVLLGQPAVSEISRHFENSLNATHALLRHFSLTAEIYSETRSSAGDAALASTLWSISYSPNARLVLDTGMDLGVTHGAPEKRIFAGVTYAFGNIYKSLTHPHPSSD